MTGSIGLDDRDDKVRGYMDDGQALWYILFGAMVEKERDELPIAKTTLILGKHYMRPHLSNNVCKIFGPDSSLPISEEQVSRLTTTNGLEMAKEWLNICREHHDCGQSQLQARSLPSRLIEVYEHGSIQHARVVERKDIQLDTQYLTLSHRWGTAPVHTLRSVNLVQYKQDIPVHEVSRTFQDAFEVTRRLGYKFIWIDSLCILQDSASDWAYEMNRMADVYENAACNLAATAHATSDKGLFPKSTASSIKMVKVTVDVELAGHKLAGVFELIPQRAWSSRVDKAPLNKRAWVFQERFLSPRILHLGKDQFLWECQKLRASETWPIGLSRLIVSDFTDDIGSYHLIIRTDPTEQKERAREAWFALIRMYTPCDLTFPSDRLPALAGIISRFSEILDDECIAGLWKTDMLRGLLWNRGWSEARHNPRARHSRAPSWSWASLDVGIYNSLTGVAHDHLAKVLSVEIRDSSESVTSAGKLRLQAPLLKSICPRRTGRFSLIDRNVRLKHGQFRLRFRYDCSPGDFDDIFAKMQDDTQHETETDARAESEDVFIWAYLLFISKQPIAGLILKRLPQPGHFLRIGYFDYSGLDPRTEDFGVLQTYLDDTYDIAQDDYGETHGDGVYTVTIV